MVKASSYLYSPHPLSVMDILPAFSVTSLRFEFEGEEILASWLMTIFPIVHVTPLGFKSKDDGMLASWFDAT